MASDPHRWAAQFAQNQQQRANQSQSDYMNALMAAFGEEAARQRPYATMPADLAQAEYNRQNMLPYEIAAEDRQFRRWGQMQDRELADQMAIIERKAELGQDGNPLDALLGGGSGNQVQIGDDGSVTYMINGKPVTIPTVR